jgi:hypothetical protein
MTDQKVFIKIFSLLVVPVPLLRDIVESFLFVLHHQESLHTGLLNNKSV